MIWPFRKIDFIIKAIKPHVGKKNEYFTTEKSIGA